MGGERFAIFISSDIAGSLYPQNIKNSTKVPVKVLVEEDNEVLTPERSAKLNAAVTGRDAAGFVSVQGRRCEETNKSKEIEVLPGRESKIYTSTKRIQVTFGVRLKNGMYMVNTKNRMMDAGQTLEIWPRHMKGGDLYNSLVEASDS